MQSDFFCFWNLKKPHARCKILRDTRPAKSTQCSAFAIMVFRTKVMQSFVTLSKGKQCNISFDQGQSYGLIWLKQKIIKYSYPCMNKYSYLYMNYKQKKIQQLLTFPEIVIKICLTSNSCAEYIKSHCWNHCWSCDINFPFIINN